MTAMREMELSEWVGRLPESHLANREYSAMKSETKRLRDALKKIGTVEFAGSCCGCGSDKGFDEVQEIASAALSEKGDEK